MKMYQAVVPHKLEAQQKVQIRGVLMDDAKEFSINFVNAPTDKLQNITYHFKLLLDEQIIVQNYKHNGVWIEHTEIDGNIMNGWFTKKMSANSRSDRLSNHFPYINGNYNNALDNGNGNYTNDNNIEHSIVGQDFAFEFLFEESKVLVYAIFVNDYTQLCAQYDLNNELADIEKIEVWGDVQKVTQLAFFYP